MSSLFVQMTVVPTGTVIACGSKTKLSILIGTFAVVGWSLALTRGDPRTAAASQSSPALPHLQSAHFSLSFACFLNLIFLHEP
jgi:hypothetical protein